MKRWETDLHLHLDGALSIGVVKTLAERIGYNFGGKDVKELLSVGETCESLVDYLKCFDLPQILLQTADALELAAYDLVIRLAAQNVVYAEIRFAPQLHKQKGMTQEQAVDAVVKGVERGCAETGIYVGVLLCAMVNGNDMENEETMELSKAYRLKGVVGADIAGPEGLVPMEHFEGLFKRVYQAGVPFTIHAGECGDYENIKKAVSFGAKRIGHGCAAVKSEMCMELLKREKITLEMCVVSNLQTKAVNGIGEHPIKTFFDRGIRVTYNTDNMTVSDTDLGREAELIRNGLGADEEMMRKMNTIAVEAGFAGEEVKREVWRRIEKEE